MHAKHASLPFHSTERPPTVPSHPHPCLRRHLLASTCKYKCDDECAVCTSTVVLDDGTKEVTVDASGCKGLTETLSWICCRGAANRTNDLTCSLKEAGCTGIGGAAVPDGKYEYGKQKCNEFQTATCECNTGAAGRLLGKGRRCLLRLRVSTGLERLQLSDASAITPVQPHPANLAPNCYHPPPRSRCACDRHHADRPGSRWQGRR